MLDKLIELLSPRWAVERMSWRARLDAARTVRKYAAAEADRLNGGWRASRASSDSELIPSIAELRGRSNQMARDNPYAASATRNLVTGIVGDGIEARAEHADPRLAQVAQEEWTEFVNAPVVNGEMDFYGGQKVGCRTTILGGEVLQVWSAVGNVPDAEVTLLPGDFLDHTLNRVIDDNRRIVGGVEFVNGKRAAYHLFEEHPGDAMRRSNKTRRVEAQYVDHVFERLWPGQTRGQPWLHAGIRALDSVDGVREAKSVKERIEACLSVIRTPALDENAAAPIGPRKPQTDGRTFETLSPGMILEGRPGETFEVVDPSRPGGGDEFLRSEIRAALTAIGVPYHIATGDVSQANYTSTRADMVPYWARLDDWVWHTFVPFQCQPAWRRIMARGALRRNEPKLVEVRAVWTPAPREWVDPLKDSLAEIAEVRAGFDSMPDALARRGKDWRSTFALAAEVNKEIDRHGLAFDTDPRRLNGSGALQAPAGYIAPRPGDAASQASEFVYRMARAEEAGDVEAAEMWLERAAGALVAGGMEQSARRLRAVAATN